MRSIEASNKAFAIQLRKHNLYILIFHLTFFIFHIALQAQLISYKYTIVLHHYQKDKIIELYWFVTVAQYAKLYINIKSTLCISLIGCIISTLIVIYNSVCILILMIVEWNLLTIHSRIFSYFYILISVIELFISILFRSKQKAEMALYTFKSIGASSERRKANYLKNAIKIMMEMAFLKGAARFYNSCLNFKKYHFLVCLIGFLFSMVTTAIIRSNLKNSTSLLRKTSYWILIIDIIFLIFDFTYFTFIIKSPRYGYITLFGLFIIVERFALYISLFFYLNGYLKIQQSLRNVNYQHKRLHL